MGIFDLLSPLFSLLDGILKFLLSPPLRLFIWGILASCLSMWLYVRLSSQKKLASVSREVTEIRKALAKYQGNFEGAKKLINKSLALSLQQISLVIKPALLASLPMLFLLVWIGNHFNYYLPKAGEIIQIDLLPAQAQVQWQPSTNLSQSEKNGSWKLSWPTPEQEVQLKDSLGQTIISFPLTVASPILHKRQWWNIFFGNRAGYIPNNSPIEQIQIALPKNRYLPFLPQWLSSAETVFLLAVFLVSLIIKLVFRIH
jgi:hypothetical protein